MSAQAKYKVDEVVRAIQGSHGIVAAAAKSLGCDRATVYRYRERHPAVAAALADERETLLDLAESTLFEKAVVDKDTTSLIFLLKTLGKSRGYLEKQQMEHSGPEGGPLEVTVRRTIVRPNGDG